MEILKDFGINPVLLTAQIVNFLILLFILNKILFKPLLKVLDERKIKIENSLLEAEKISVELARAEKTGKEIVEAAQTRSDQIVMAAEVASAKIQTTAQSQAKKESERILEKGKAALGLEREKMRSSLRSELMEVVVLATEKIMGKSLSDKEIEKITTKSLKDLS